MGDIRHIRALLEKTHAGIGEDWEQARRSWTGTEGREFTRAHVYPVQESLQQVLDALDKVADAAEQFEREMG
jgi:hypothetical protein